jgi:hypothetical protein
MPTKHSEAVWNARVIGAGPFPIDMLRYDACVPRNESDSAVVSESAHDKTWVRHSVNVQGRGPLGPTTARWASFGWQVVYADATLNTIGSDERQRDYVDGYMAYEREDYATWHVDEDGRKVYDTCEDDMYDDIPQECVDTLN